MRHRRQHQNCFDHGETLADADARSTAERHISEAGQLTCKIAHPALGTERFRLAEVTRVAMQDPRGDEDGRSFWERVASKLDRLRGFPADGPRRRVKPHGFHHHAFRKFEVRNIVGRRRAIAKHFCDFGCEACFSVRMLAEQEPCP